MPSRLSHTINKFSYKTLFLVVILLLIPIVLMVRINQKRTKVSAAWWNETWTYRKLISITNSSGSPLTNQRIKFQIDTQTLISTGKMKNNCDDIRITDVNGKLLDHWDTDCNSASTSIYVKTEILPTSGTDIYLYYGNPSASAIEKNLGTADNPGTSCQMMKDQGSALSNGTYYIVPQGVDANKMFVFCDQTNDSGGWNLIVNQNIPSGGYFTAGEAPNINESNPTAAKYSILNRLSRFKQNSIYTFKLNWPGYSPVNIWSQASNPTSETISGYTPLSIGASSNNWGGIYLSDDSGATYLDGSPGSGPSNWWYAIASYTAWSGGLPSASTVSGTGVPRVQLWVRGGDDMLNTSTSVSGSEEISQGPVVYFKFDEGIGTTAYDASSNRNSALVSGASWLTDDQCLSGKCLSFTNGSSHYVRGGNPSNKTLDLGTADFTISAWAKIKPGSTNRGTVITKSNDVTMADTLGYWLTSSYNGDSFRFYINDGSGSSFITTSAGSSYTDGSWHHVVVTGDRDGSMVMYVDGKQTGSTNISALGNVDNNSTFGIGSYQGSGSNVHNGSIDEVKIYRYVRTAAQIKADYAAGISGQSSSKGSSVNMGSSINSGKSLSDGLAAYWKFDESSGNSSDSSGNNNTANLSGSSQYTSGKYGNAFRPGVGTTNIIPNPSFENNSTGYTGVPTSWSQAIWPGAGTGIVGQTNADYLFGNNSVKVNNYDGVNQVFAVTNASISIGTTYTYSCWVKSNTDKANVDIYSGSSWYTTYLSASRLNQWTRLSTTFVATAASTNPRAGIYMGTGIAIFDGCQLEVSNAATPYFDGSFGAGFSWTGTVHNSASVRLYSFATANNSTSLDIGGTQISFAAWVYPRSYASPEAYNVIFQKNGYTSGYRMMIDSIGHAYFGIGESQGGVLTTTGSIPLNTWSHLAMTYDGRTINGYINGKLDTSKVYSGALASTSNPVVFGNTEYPHLNGAYDEIRIYNRAISANEISNLYKSATGPVGYWKFDEGVGTSANSSAGTTSGCTLYNSPSWSSGKFGKALNFNGSNNYLDCGNDSSLNSSNNLTLEAWVMPTSSDGNWSSIISKSAKQAYFLMQRDGNQSITFGIYLSDGYKEVSINSSDITLNQWQHVAATYDGSVERIYLNGVQKATNAATGTINNLSTSNLILGASTTSSERFAGGIDEVKIYSYPRSQKEIVEDMNAGHPIGGSPVASQLAYWKFDEGFGSTSPNWGYGGKPLSANLTNTNWNNDGKYGKALSFNGSSSLASASPVTQINNTSFSISGWMKITSQPAYYSSMLMSSGSGFVLYFTQNSRQPWTQVYNGSSWIQAGCSTSSLNLNEWGYLAMTYDETTKLLKTYFNGRKCSSDITVTGGINDAYSTTLNIGTYAGNFHDGLIDEVKIYNTALSDEDIKLDYNQGKSMQLGSLSSGTGNTAPSSAGSQIYCVPGDTSPCSPPVGEWKLDEGVGTTAYDTSGNNNHGTFVGGTLPTWSSGKYGKGVLFNGYNNGVNVPDPGASVLDMSGPFTAQAWVKWKSFKDYGVIFNKGTGGGASGFNYALWSYGSSLIGYIGNGSSTNSVSAATLPSLNQWHHIAIIADGTYFSMYIDGKFSNRVNQTISVTPNNQPFMISDNIATLTPNAFVDQVQVYNYARTPAQIALDYNRGAPAAHWKLDDCQGTQLTDWSGNANHITLNIGPSGTQTSAGTCQTPGTAWGNGSTGKFNSALKLDGNDDKGSGPSGAYNNVATSNFTVSSWLKTSDSGSQSSILSTAGGAKGFRFGFSGGKPYFLYGDGTNYKEGSIGSVNINDDQWHLITLRYLYNNRVESYVDGKYTGFIDMAIMTGSASNGSSIFFGTLNGTNGAVNGLVDDIRFYNYALTPDQIKTIYNNGAVNFYSH